MSRSFYTTQIYAELYAGSNVFSAQISATPTAFGLTAPQAASYATLNDTFGAAYLAAVSPETRTKGTLLARDNAAKALRASAVELAKIIDATPTVTDTQRANLGLNVRKTPSPKGNPGTASNFKVALNGDGSIDLTWKCNNPAGTTGTIYQIFRRIGAVGEFEYLGGVGDKKYHDTTIPAGTATVTYKIQAVRSTAVGDWAELNVNFGTAAGGGMTASVEPAPKLAA
jgi:ribosomal protein S11